MEGCMKRCDGGEVQEKGKDRKAKEGRVSTMMVFVERTLAELSHGVEER